MSSGLGPSQARPGTPSSPRRRAHCQESHSRPGLWRPPLTFFDSFSETSRSSTSCSSTCSSSISPYSRFSSTMGLPPLFDQGYLAQPARVAVVAGLRARGARSPCSPTSNALRVRSWSGRTGSERRPRRCDRSGSQALRSPARSSADDWVLTVADTQARQTSCVTGPRRVQARCGSSSLPQVRHPSARRADCRWRVKRR